MGGYIGNEPTTGHFPVDNFTSSGGSTYTLSKTPGSAGAIEVSVQGVLQPTTAYTVSGTTLTMAGVTSGVKIFVRHLGETLVLPTPADGTVTATKLAVNSVDGTKIAMGSDARGDILYHGATDYARLAKGTSGQVLTMGANDPAWADAAGGAWAVKASGTFSSTSELVVTSVTKTLKAYLSYIPSASSHIYMLTSTDGGSSWGGSPYYDIANICGQHGSSSLVYERNNNQGLFWLNSGSAANTNSASGSNVIVELTLHTPESNRAKLATWDVAYPTTIAEDDNLLYTVIGKGTWNNSTAINAIKFYPSSGTFSAGTYTILELN